MKIKNVNTFKEYYTTETDKCLTLDYRKNFRIIFNEEKNEFNTFLYDEKTHDCFIHLNKETEAEWSFNFLKLNLVDLKIFKGLANKSYHFGSTNLSSYIYYMRNSIIYILNIHEQKVVFKTSIDNNLLDLNDLVDLESIENSDDIIALEKKSKKIVYFSMIKSNQEIKLKIFSPPAKYSGVSSIKIKKNMLMAYQKPKYHLILFDLNRVKADGCFSEASKVFDKKIIDRNLMFDLSRNLKYLIVFQYPRTLYLYRTSNYDLIALVPIKARIKEIVSNHKYLTALLDTNEIVSLMICDTKVTNVQDILKAIDYK